MGTGKAPRIVDAEITEDGHLVVKFNAASKIYPHTAQAVFDPAALLGLVEEYAEIPPASETDYPGVPMVTEAAVFDDADGQGRARKPKKQGD